MRDPPQRDVKALLVWAAVTYVVFSAFAMWASTLALRGRDYATTQRGGGGLARRRMRRGERILAYAVILLVLVLVLAPHIGLLLLSFATVWSFSPLPDAFTLAHYGRVLGDTDRRLLYRLRAE